MKIAVLIAATAGLAACAPPLVRHEHQALKPIARLDCPEAQGALSRSSQAPDGSACGYAGPDGASVQLKLVQVSGPPEGVVQPLEAQLKSLLPPAPPAPEGPPPAVGEGHDKVDINLPGISIHANDQGAKVHVPGVNVDADDQHNTAHVVANAPGQPFGPPGQGQVTVDANDGGAVIHVRSFGPNFNETLILASKTPGPQGWRTVGYEALGPRAGPLVVATVQSKSDEHETLFNDVRSLVRNVAGG